MNIHQTRSYTLTTGSDTLDGASLDLEEVATYAHLLESQCPVLATLPAGVTLRPFLTTTDGVRRAALRVEGGTLPSGTVLSGVLSTVSAQP